MRYLYLLLFLITFSYADLQDFSTRQDVLQKIKQVIFDEEAIATAYEFYILNTYSLPDDLNTLKTSDYLGITFGTVDSTYFNSLSLSTTASLALKYAIKDNIISDTNLKSIYDSDTFRKKTYVYKDKVYFKLEDDFAKNIFVLISTQDSGLSICGDIPKTQYCTKNGHIYLYTDNTQNDTKLLMYYYAEKFQTGPIIISNDTTLYDTRSEFKNLPLGILMYDTDGVKYVKTSTSIEKVK
ncbi:MAG: hypothetical protein ACNI28_09720 [Arcobacter sp.]|uniref:hypothetical protein n=1 Tax=Arcobacter sp. TaxID=1872629 RepID=UPI003AFFCA2C